MTRHKRHKKIKNNSLGLPLLVVPIVFLIFLSENKKYDRTCHFGSSSRRFLIFQFFIKQKTRQDLPCGRSSRYIAKKKKGPAGTLKPLDPREHITFVLVWSQDYICCSCFFALAPSTCQPALTSSFTRAFAFSRSLSRRPCSSSVLIFSMILI